MNGTRVHVQEPDEVEAFLRILIRRRVWFILAFLIVAVLGFAWAFSSKPRFTLAFDYAIEADSMFGTDYAVPGGQEYLIRPELVQGMASVEAQNLAKPFALSHPTFFRSSLGKHVELSIQQESILAFSMPVTEGNEELALEFANNLAQFVSNAIQSVYDRQTEDVQEAAKSIGTEMNEITELLKKSDGEPEEVIPLARLLTEQSNKLAAYNLRVQRPLTAAIQAEPFVSDIPIGMSRTVRIILALFMALVIATLVSLAAEYLARATRPM